MKTIWKFLVEITDAPIVQMPAGAEILSVALDPMGELAVWALVESTHAPAPVQLHLVGTGQRAEHVTGPVSMYGVVYLDTVRQGLFMWHVFVTTSESVFVR